MLKDFIQPFVQITTLLEYTHSLLISNAYLATSGIFRKKKFSCLKFQLSSMCLKIQYQILRKLNCKFYHILLRELNCRFDHIVNVRSENFDHKFLIVCLLNPECLACLNLEMLVKGQRRFKNFILSKKLEFELSGSAFIYIINLNASLYFFKNRFSKSILGWSNYTKCLNLSRQ